MPYIGKSIDGFGIRERFTYVVSAGATSISGADANGRTLLFEDPEYVDVFLNGVRLKKDTDYNTSTANTIAGLAALAASDEVEVIVNDIFTLADMVSANNGGDFRGDLSIAKDSGVLSFGADKEVTLTHSADAGLNLKHTATGDNNPIVLTLQTGETDMQADDVIGSLNFQAPDEATGTDAILVAAGIDAVSEGDFSSTNNATKLSFKTASSAAAAETMSLSSAGVLTVASNIVSSGTITGGGLLTTGGNIVIPDAGTIGSASDTNAIAISSAGVITISTNTDSSNSTTGAIVAHSAGFADDVNIGDALNVTGAITGSSTIQGTTITATTAFVPDANDGASLGTSSLEFSDLFLADGGKIEFGNDQDANITHTSGAALTTNASFTSTSTLQGTTITATTAFVPDASDGAALGSATLEFSDLFLADGGEVKFGADQDVLLRHDHNSGLIIDRTNTSDNSPTTLTLQTGETDIQANDVLGTINFQAPDEATGTDAILVAAGIDAVSEGDFSASSNATKLSFKTAASATAAETMSLSSGGNLTVSGNVSVGGDLDVTGSFDMSDANITNVGSIALDSISGDADSNTSITFSGSDVITFATGGSTAFTANADQTVTFSGAITSNAGVVVDNITIDGTEIDLSSGSLTVDSAANITLDCGTGELLFNNGGNGNLLKIQADSNNVNFIGMVQDKDLVFKGDDGGSTITALTLDMSDAGKAIFNAGATFADGMTITTADNTTQLTLVSTDADENTGPNLDFYRNSSSPADGDLMGRITFFGENSADEKIEYGNLQFRNTDVTDGTEDATVLLVKMHGGAAVQVFGSNATETVFNDNSVDIDFRVESNGDANCLFVDGANDKVGIGTNTPDGFLTISKNTGQADLPSIRLIDNTDAREAFITNQSGDLFMGTNNSSDDVVDSCIQITTNVIVTKTQNLERTRVNSDGYFYVNTGGVEPSASQVGVRITGTQGQNFWKSANSGTTGYDHLVFFNGNGSVGSIITSGSNTTYSTSSDYRLKENVVTDWDATTRLKQLKPSRFNFIADADTTVDGFLAHEVASIVPEAISGTKDATEDAANVVLNADGIVLNTNVSKEDWTEGKSDETYASDTTWVASKTVPKYQGIDQSKLVPLLTKTLQEALTRIDTLETSNKELETRIKSLEDA